MEVVGSPPVFLYSDTREIPQKQDDTRFSSVLADFKSFEEFVNSQMVAISTPH